MKEIMTPTTTTTLYPPPYPASYHPTADLDHELLRSIKGGQPKGTMDENK